MTSSWSTRHKEKSAGMLLKATVSSFFLLETEMGEELHQLLCDHKGKAKGTAETLTLMAPDYYSALNCCFKTLLRRKEN